MGVEDLVGWEVRDLMTQQNWRNMAKLEKALHQLTMHVPLGRRLHRKCGGGAYPYPGTEGVCMGCTSSSAGVATAPSSSVTILLGGRRHGNVRSRVMEDFYQSVHGTDDVSGGEVNRGSDDAAREDNGRSACSSRPELHHQVRIQVRLLLFSPIWGFSSFKSKPAAQRSSVGPGNPGICQTAACTWTLRCPSPASAARAL